MVKAIYGDKTDLLQRESMGVITNDLQSVFKQKYVDQMFEKQPYELKKKPSFIFTCCDPNGGGTSQMALVSIAVELNKVVILAADSHPVKGHEQIQQLLIGHLEGLRKIPDYCDSWIIFIPEANLGHEADHMEFMIRNYRRVYTVHEKDRIGIMTTNVRKELYAMETTRYLSQNALEICNKFIVTNTRGQPTMEKERTHILEVSISYGKLVSQSHQKHKFYKLVSIYYIATS